MTVGILQFHLVIKNQNYELMGLKQWKNFNKTIIRFNTVWQTKRNSCINTAASNALFRWWA